MVIMISKNIRKYRKDRGLTQEQLAEAVGVTVGAVSKWESGLSNPDINLIVELADFFDTSVDVLLGYELRKNNVDKVAEHIKTLRMEKKYDEGKIIVEKNLQKYPNNFNVVHESAILYEMKGIEVGDKQALDRALVLFQHACNLISQNTDEDISEVTLQNSIGTIYMALGDTEKAVEQLKKYNYDGLNDGDIGFYLMTDERYDESLPYLSKSLINCVAKLFKTMSGYINYFAYKRDHSQALEVIQWLHSILKGLKTSADVSYIDKMEVMVFTACAQVYGEMEKFDYAKDYLNKARDLAKSFDASPDYNLNNLKYFYGKNTSLSDDFGVNATQGIINRIHANEKTKNELMRLWEELENEDK